MLCRMSGIEQPAGQRVKAGRMQRSRVSLGLLSVLLITAIAVAISRAESAWIGLEGAAMGLALFTGCLAVAALRKRKT